MKGCADTTEIINEVESLISFVNYGKQRITTFTSKIKELEREIPIVRNKAQCLFYSKSCVELQNLIQMTDETLLDWRIKTTSYLCMLRKMQQRKYQSQLKRLNLKSLELKATNLLEMINDQSFSIEKIFVRIENMKAVLEEKQIQLQAALRKGRVLGLERYKQMVLQREVVAEFV